MADKNLPQISFTAPDFPDQFVDSLRCYGFASVIDHPIDSERVRRIYRDWREFFAADEINIFEMDPTNQDGFFSLERAEHAKGFLDRDHKEYFQFYPWGRCPSNLRRDLAIHFQTTVALGAKLLEHIGSLLPEYISLVLSEPLRDMIRDSQQSMLRILHYPPIPSGKEVIRAAPHEDINLLTLLPEADGSGLEIKLRDGKWLAVPNSPGQLIVNIGDMLQEATGGFFPSTTHRVATFETHESATSRMSLPLFLHPRPEVVLSKRYTARSYLHERLEELGVI